MKNPPDEPPADGPLSHDAKEVMDEIVRALLKPGNDAIWSSDDPTTRLYEKIKPRKSMKTDK